MSILANIRSALTGASPQNIAGRPKAAAGSTTIFAPPPPGQARGQAPGADLLKVGTVDLTDPTFEHSGTLLRAAHAAKEDRRALRHADADALKARTAARRYFGSPNRGLPPQPKTMRNIEELAGATFKTKAFVEELWAALPIVANFDAQILAVAEARQSDAEVSIAAAVRETSDPALVSRMEAQFAGGPGEWLATRSAKLRILKTERRAFMLRLRPAFVALAERIEAAANKVLAKMEKEERDFAEQWGIEFIASIALERIAAMTWYPSEAINSAIEFHPKHLLAQLGLELPPKP